MHENGQWARRSQHVVANIFLDEPFKVLTMKDASDFASIQERIYNKIPNDAAESSVIAGLIAEAKRLVDAATAWTTPSPTPSIPSTRCRRPLASSLPAS